MSPLLQAKVARGLSAGRVQSVAVRMVVERERKIRAFVPEEYWQLKARLKTAKGQDLLVEVSKFQGRTFRPDNEAQTRAAMAQLEGARYVVSNREDKRTRSKPSAPFITSTMQQAASTRLGFSVKKTMTIAQQLYEAGYITYMRTDSTNLSREAVDACREFIAAEYGDRYLPGATNTYSSKQGAQEAHEAIRPSNVRCMAAELTDMAREAQRLYELIWQQFVACQMTDAQLTGTSLTVTAGATELRAKGRVIQFDGFLKVLQPPTRQEDDRVLPDVGQGETLVLQGLDPSQHFTKPPPRYTEAGLVTELEKRGIGRPSTYASLISTIQERGYVKVKKRRFYAEKIGDIVTVRLVECFADLMEYGFTASMETTLDEVADGKRDWKRLLDKFFGGFRVSVAHAERKEGGMRPNDPTKTSIQCTNCGRPMWIWTSTTGLFLSCLGVGPARWKRKGCKTINLTPIDEALDLDANEEAEALLLQSKRRCRLCNTVMDTYWIDNGTRKLQVCGNNPDCSGCDVLD